MTTIEAPVIEEIDETLDFDDEPPLEVHIYNFSSMLKGEAICGLPMTEDRHKGRHGAKMYEGETACAVCGVPVCLNCMLAVDPIWMQKGEPK